MTDPNSYRPTGPFAVDDTGTIHTIVDRTGMIAAIDSLHRKIHTGNGFSLAIDAGTIGAAASYDIAFLTGANTVHLKNVTVWSEASHVELVFYESSSSPAGGSAASVFQRNRNIPVPSTVTVTQGLTGITHGTELERIPFGGGGGFFSASGGSADSEIEWVLIPNTLYTFEIFNESGAGGDTHLLTTWYEE